MDARRVSRVFLTASAFLVALLFAFGPGASASAQDGKVAISQKSVDEAKADLKKLGPEPKAFVLISKIVLPSVVTVVTKHKEKVAQMPDMFGDEWPFDVPNPFPRNRRRAPQQAPEQDVFSMGSGFVVDKAGHILTNNHVVEGAVEIKVRLADDSQYEATLVGTDKATDLAVIKLKDCPAEKLVPVTLGDSSRLEVGDWVLAVGAPFGFSKSVSAGIVSAVGRSGLMEHSEREIHYENFIQTDAAINRGNSGGPLVNYAAEVIGINAAIETPSGASAGVGFAIPTSLARPVMEQLISKGKVVRGWLGVTIREVTEDDVKKMKLENREGIYVDEVKPGTPAMDAGIQAKDIILKVNGKTPDSVVALQSTIAATEPGKKVSLEILRDGKPKTVDVTIQELPSQLPTAELAYKDKDLGISVQSLTGDLAQQLQAYQGDKGVLVMEVAKDSAAERAGIRRGDLIKEIANKPIATAGEYQAIREKTPLDKGVFLLVKTGDNNARLVLVMVK